jgi:cobalamin synthase
MELEDIKNLLNRKLENEQVNKSANDIAVLLHKKTSSVITKLKKSLLFEIVFSGFALLIFLYVSVFSKYNSIQIYFTFFTVLLLAMIIVLVLLYKKVNTLSKAHLNKPVKQNLESIHKILNEFIKRYFQLTMLLIPVCFIFSAYLGYQDGKKGITITEVEKFNSLFQTKDQLSIFLIVYIIVFSLAAYYFTKWYLNKLYGRYLKNLEECIKELSY